MTTLTYTNDYQLTVLNYSGGRQSSAILWMVLLGEIERPEEFLVLNADPGMENAATYRYNKEMRKECEAAGIEFQTVPGPNLLKDLTAENRGTHLDNPSYWTRDANQKMGRLIQKCTKYYKIAPMDRAVRKELNKRFGTSLDSKRLGENIVCKWIGFSSNEVYRIKPPEQKYIEFQYPLIDLGMDDAAVMRFYEDHRLPAPPRSVCNACFSNGVDTFRDMYDYRPLDWYHAVRVDDAIRDMSDVGAQEECFVSKTLIPLRELAANDFKGVDGNEMEGGHSCDSGYCFT